MSSLATGKRTYAAAAAGVPERPAPGAKRSDARYDAPLTSLLHSDRLTHAAANDDDVDDDVKSVGSQHYFRPEDDPTAWTAELATADKLAREMLAFAMPRDSSHSLSTMRAGNDVSSGTTNGAQSKSKSSHWPQVPPEPSPDAAQLFMPRVAVGAFGDLLPRPGLAAMGTLPPQRGSGSAGKLKPASADSNFAPGGSASASSSTASKDSQRSSSGNSGPLLHLPPAGMQLSPGVLTGAVTPSPMPTAKVSATPVPRVVVGAANQPPAAKAVAAPPQVVTVGVSAAVTAERLREEQQQQQQHQQKHSNADAQGELTVEAPLKIRNVYVAALPMDFTDADLGELLSQFGKLKSCRMFTDTGRVAEIGRAYGFALFEDAAAAEAAVAALDGKPFRNARLQCQLSRNGVVKKPKDRRRGGFRGEASGDASGLLSRSTLDVSRRPGNDEHDDTPPTPRTPPASTTPPRTPRADRYTGQAVASVAPRQQRSPQSETSPTTTPPAATLPTPLPPQQLPQPQLQPWPYVTMASYPGVSAGYPSMMMPHGGSTPSGPAAYPGPYGFPTYAGYAVPPSAQGYPMPAAAASYPMPAYGGYGGFPMAPPPPPGFPGSQVTTVVYHYHYPTAPSSSS